MQAAMPPLCLLSWASVPGTRGPDPQSTANAATTLVGRLKGTPAFFEGQKSPRQISQPRIPDAFGMAMGLLGQGS